MDCDEAEHALLDYREGQLDLRRQTRLEAHLLVCDRCLTRLRDLETMLAALADARAPEPSRLAVPRIRDRIAAERGRAREVRWAWARLASAAAALFVIAGSGTSAVLSSGLAGADLDRPLASMASSVDGSSMTSALTLWRAPLLEQEAIDAFAGLMELPESEIEDLLARLRG